MRSRVRFCRMRNCFVVPGRPSDGDESKTPEVVRLFGLTHRIQDAFFYNIPFMSTGRSSSSKNIGTRVDRELIQYYTTNKLEGVRVTVKPGSKPRKLKPHAFTLQAIQRLQDERLRVIAVQVSVRLGAVASAMDIVAVRTETTRGGAAGELVQIEVKTGGEKGLNERKHGKMPPPFNALYFCTMTKYMMQAAWCHEAARQNGMKMGTPMVLVLNKTKASKDGPGILTPVHASLMDKEAVAVLVNRIAPPSR